MKKKKENRKPILYQKYQMAHGLSVLESQKAVTEKKLVKSVSRACANIMMLIIFWGMVFLSGIGIVTLLDAEMRTMLLQMLQS